MGQLVEGRRRRGWRGEVPLAEILGEWCPLRHFAQGCCPDPSRLHWPAGQAAGFSARQDIGLGEPGSE